MDKPILSARPTKEGGLSIDFRIAGGWRGRVEFDPYGKLIGHECDARVPVREPYPMPEGHDPEREARRMKQGGCCGQASE